MKRVFNIHTSNRCLPNITVLCVKRASRETRQYNLEKGSCPVIDTSGRLENFQYCNYETNSIRRLRIFTNSLLVEIKG